MSTQQYLNEYLERYRSVWESSDPELRKVLGLRMVEFLAFMRDKVEIYNRMVQELQAELGKYIEKGGN